MNLGDGLLFELENGKPRLILLSHAVGKNPAKLSGRPRVANILSSRQPACVEEVQGGERPSRQLVERPGETRSMAGGGGIVGGTTATSFTSNTTTTAGRNTTLTSRAHENHKGNNVKVVAKVKSERHKPSNASSILKVNGKTGHLQTSGTRANGKVGPKDSMVDGDAGLKDSVVCLTNEQLQQILNTVQTPNNGQHTPGDHRTEGNQIGLTSGSLKSKRGGGRELNKEDEKKEIKESGGGTDSTGNSQDKDSRLSGCLFSWLEGQQLDNRSINAKKAEWRRQLDEQLALKQQQQQRSAPGRLQAEEDAESVLSVQSCVSHRDLPAAIRSSLRLGEVTPMEEGLSVERKDEERRRWLEELDRQREEAAERRRREKLLRNQSEDHELWRNHFDSLQRRPTVPLAPSAPPPAPSNMSERREWDPSSSLSLDWGAMSSCGAESVGGASIDTAGGFPTRPSHLRTMTALLDPTQIEERERRRLKQLEQQRAIEAQMEERRRQREQEEAKRKKEEEEEERRLVMEREILGRRYEMDSLVERQKEEQQSKGHDDERHRETEQPIVTGEGESLGQKVNSSASSYKDTAVQTEEAASLPLKVKAPYVSAQYRPAPPSLSAAPPNSQGRAAKTGKENICKPGRGGEGGGGGGGGEDLYEAFARTDRSRRDKRRPEWNTQRPSRRFVPASERYPAPLQRNRQESRLRRQAELLALQERTCLSRAELPPPPPPLQQQQQQQQQRLCYDPSQTRTSPCRKVETVRGHSISLANNTERGRSPPVPAVRHRVQSQQAPVTSSSDPQPPPVLDFIPYLRTDEVFNLDPLEPASTPPPLTHTDPPSHVSTPASHRDPLLHPELRRNTKTHRQEEILRGLAQLRQGLLQKQRELETDLNPLLKRHDNELKPPSAAHCM